MTTPRTDRLQHERFCLPSPGETEVRTETYSQPRYAADGVTAIGQARIHRCLECGAMTVDGQPVA